MVVFVLVHSPAHARKLLLSCTSSKLIYLLVHVKKLGLFFDGGITIAATDGVRDEVMALVYGIAINTLLRVLNGGEHRMLV